MSKEVSQLDLQKYYPEELEILSIAEEEDNITLFMKSRSISYICPTVVVKQTSIMVHIVERCKTFLY